MDRSCCAWAQSSHGTILQAGHACWRSACGSASMHAWMVRTWPCKRSCVLGHVSITSPPINVGLTYVSMTWPRHANKPCPLTGKVRSCPQCANDRDRQQPFAMPNCVPQSRLLSMRHVPPCCVCSDISDASEGFSAVPTPATHAWPRRTLRATLAPDRCVLWSYDVIA